MTPPTFAPRDPATLHPMLMPRWVRLMSLIRKGGMNPIAVFFYRSRAAQDRLYQIGRRGIPGERIVTNAQGGQSWHNVERNGKPASLAVDIALMTPDGKQYLPDHDEAWERAGKLSEECGLTWGGRWKMRDLSHHQLDSRGRLSLQEAMQGVDPDEESA